MNKQKISHWLERTFYIVDEDKGPCVKLVLRHVTQGSNSSKDGEVWSMKVETGEDVVAVPEEDIIIIVNEIEQASFDDAEGLGGLQKYKLLAYFSRESVPRRFSFRMTGSHDEDEDETGLSEPATKQGHLGQMMRHNEALMRITMLSASQNMGIMSKTISTQATQIDKLLTDRQEYFETMEDLKSKRHERDLMTQEVEQRTLLQKEMLDSAKLLLPAVANRLAGKKILNEKDPMAMGLKALVESLNSEQLQGMMSTLSPQQQILLAEFIQTSQGDDGKEDTKRLEEGMKNGN